MALQFFLQIQPVHKSPRSATYYEHARPSNNYSSFMKIYLEYDNDRSRYHARIVTHCDRNGPYFHYSLAFSLFDQTPDEISPSVRSGKSSKYENIQYGSMSSYWGDLGFHCQNGTGSSNRVYDATTDLYFNHAYTSSISWALYSEGGGGTGWRISSADGTPDVPPKPYSPPDIWLNPNDYTKIGRVGVTKYNVHYSLSSGTNGLRWSRAQLFNYSTKNHIWHQEFNRTSSSSGYWDSYVLPSSNFSDGSRYRMAMSTWDGTTEPWSPNNPGAGGDGLLVYTYQQPTINSSISGTSPINANTADTFTISGINNRAWENYENVFKTYYRIKYSDNTTSSWTDAGNVTSITRTAEQIRSLIPNKWDGKTVYFQAKRNNPSAGWDSSTIAQMSLVVYYRPKLDISDSNTTYRLNNASQNTINKGQFVKNDSSLTGIYVTWNYDLTKPEAGYTQGYRVRLYNSSKQLVKTYYTDNKFITIPKADIPKLQDTYIDITPYYKNNSSSADSFWYYNGTISTMKFVYLVSVLNTPVITYPVNNSNWINNKFRVCFQLPADPDKSAVSGTYLYDDIELQINNSFTIRMKDSDKHTTTGTNLISENCYSALNSNLTYERKMVINPSLANNFPNTKTYTIKVRVKKKYGNTSLFSTWSEWSAPITISVNKPVYSVSQGDKILSSHFNNTRSLVDRITKTYGISFTLPSIANSGSTFIAKSQYVYTILSKGLVDTKNRVNNYATFDTTQQAVKFDNENMLIDNFTPTTEVVTAESNENNAPNGRNYMKIIYDRSNYLI